MLKKLFLITLITLILPSCHIDNNSIDPNMVNETTTNEYSLDYREAMRQWVIRISELSKDKNPDFIIIPQNSSPLFTDTGDVDGQLSNEFLDSIDGVGQEGISFGYDEFNKATNIEDRNYITSLLNVGTQNGIIVLSINYANNHSNVNKARTYDSQNNFLSYVSYNVELIDIQENTINENDKDILSLDDAKNWLCLLNPEKFEDKEVYLNDLCKTNYDVLVIDSFFNKDEMLTNKDINRLKIKENGSKRLVISYLSIGEAEDYRYYWDDKYYDNPPIWLMNENPNWEGNYPVKYWNDDWQRIIATDNNSYLNKIINAGFDGVYLDIVDGYETFEDMEN